uniref:Auxin-responsive protein n=1 Tax=Lagerstroemia indica TaxID=141186 RepID=A0A7U1BKH4_9MYRT|nr:AUX22-like protein [Lagerstroemia indica]
MAVEGLGLGLEITELRLGLPGAEGTTFMAKNEKKKRGFSEIIWEGLGSKDHDDGKAPVAKSQVVGWPPVCSYRKKNSFSEKDCVESSKNISVKVSMDGAIYLRKIDLGMQRGYSELALALEKLFGCCGIGEGLKEAESGEYKLIYEDKDGDWMLVGDVPWEMFVDSCKRLRIMKRSEAGDLGLSRERDFLKEAFSKDQ